MEIHRTIRKRIQSSPLVQTVIRVFSERGRPLAALVLLTSCLLMLMADWPVWWPPLPKPVSAVVQWLAGSYSSGRHFLFDRYQREAPRQVRSQPVTIVAIDEKSLAELGQWPWPRHRLAALIDAINRHDPAAIGLDIYMPEVDQTSPGEVARSLHDAHPELAARLSALPGNDELLAQTLRRTPSVLGAAGFDFRTYTTSEGLRTWPLVLSGAERLPPIVRDYPAVLASLPVLQAAAAGQALLSVDSADGIVRRMPLVATVASHPVPSLAVEMFRVGLGAPRTEVLLDRRGIAQVRVGELLVPTQLPGDVHLHFARAEQTRGRYVSALDVLSARVDPQALSGKLVLIGLTGMGLNDMRITALGEHVPGIEIQAQLIESLFDQRFLLRPWWMIFAEIVFTLIVGALMIWLVPRVQPSHRLGAIYRLPKAGVLASLGINALAVSTGFYLFRSLGLMFDAASFFLVTSAVFGMLFTFVQASAARAREVQRERQWQEMMDRVARAESALAERSQVSGGS